MPRKWRLQQFYLTPQELQLEDPVQIQTHVSKSLRFWPACIYTSKHWGRVFAQVHKLCYEHDWVMFPFKQDPYKQSRGQGILNLGKQDKPEKDATWIWDWYFSQGYPKYWCISSSRSALRDHKRNVKTPWHRDHFLGCPSEANEDNVYHAMMSARVCLHGRSCGSSTTLWNHS